MNKSQLKAVLGSLNVNDLVTLNFRGSSQRTSDNGDYRFVSTVRGRGKGGSLISTFKHVNSAGLIMVGTKDSEHVLSVRYPVIVDGKNSMAVVGDASDALAPVQYSTERNARRAAEMKEVCKQLLDTGFHGRFHKVKIDSSVADLSGVFTLSEAKQLRGRVGQVVLTLTRDGSAPVKLCSYTHSAVVSAINIVA